MFKEYDDFYFKVERDEFNSKHFGLQMGNVTVCRIREKGFNEKSACAVAEAINCARQNGFQHLSCRVDTSEKALARSFQQEGFQIVDTLVTYCFRFEESKLPQVDSRCELRDCREDDIPQLRTIAGTSFRMGRFHSDPALSDDLCDRYYEQWFENSCHGLADKVTVACVDGTPVGFATAVCPREGEYARMGLIAVSEAARGKGIGAALELEMLRWSKKQITQRPKVQGFLHGTQIDNLAMQRILGRMKFLMHTSQYVFHCTI